MEVRATTPKLVHVPQVPPLIETREKAISPAILPPKIVIDQSTEPSPSRLIAPDDHVESIKATYEDQITTLQ